MQGNRLRLLCNPLAIGQDRSDISSIIRVSGLSELTLSNSQNAYHWR